MSRLFLGAFPLAGSLLFAHAARFVFRWGYKLRPKRTLRLMDVIKVGRTFSSQEELVVLPVA